MSASIYTICLNSSKTFLIVTMPSSMRSSPRVMKSMYSFNTRTVPVLRHNFLAVNLFSGPFQWLCSGFSIFPVISQNHRLIKIRSTNTKVNLESLLTSKMEFCVMIVNSIAKSHILDVPGVSGYIIIITGFCLQCRYTSLVTGNF